MPSRVDKWREVLQKCIAQLESSRLAYLSNKKDSECKVEPDGTAICKSKVDGGGNCTACTRQQETCRFINTVRVQEIEELKKVLNNVIM